MMILAMALGFILGLIAMFAVGGGPVRSFGVERRQERTMRDEFLGEDAQGRDEPARFDIGDVVMLRSGGLKMTVTKVDASSGDMRCMYHNITAANSQLYSATFPPGALVLHAEYLESELCKARLSKVSELEAPRA